MSNNHTHRLGVIFEQLEDRSLPSSFGVPWADPGRMTLSFAPDGTVTPTSASSLSTELATAGTSAAWKSEILRAFQTWAVNANINIGLVADGGQALGTAGAVQGDARFGDVRVGAAALGTALVASAAPFTWTGTTYAGDVLLNTAQNFRIGSAPGSYDLFSVALHEAGHVFGLGHDDHDTVMNAGYLFSAGLSAAEIADLRALYGTRTADEFDAKAANGTIATASSLKPDMTAGRPFAEADLTTTGDVDFYKFKADTSTARVLLQAKGLSLLQAKVSVYTASGQLVATKSAADVLNNDVSIDLAGLSANATYYIKVEAATANVFGVGSYRLTAFTGADKTPKSLKPEPVTDAHTNDTWGQATSLVHPSKIYLDSRFDATYRGAIEDATDTDFYRVRVLTPTAGGAVNMNVVVWATDGTLNPRVRVLNALGHPVAFKVLANDAGLTSVVVPAATPGAIYYVQVASRTAGGTGGYVMGADFNQSAQPLTQQVGGGTVSPTSLTDTGTLSVTAAGIYQFSLYAEPVTTGGGGVTLSVTNSAGQVVFTLDADSGQPAMTVAKYLATGTYTFRYTYRSVCGLTPAPIHYHLGLLKLTDDVGTYAPPGGSSSSPTYTSSKTYSSGTWYFF